jgi:integrative and conjugative element protein (TIGR02256 family)
VARCSVLNLFSGWRHDAWERSFRASNQRLRIESRVLRHVRRYRQSRSRSHESGGQLFGTVTPDLVTICAVSGPHARDQRSRYSFRSDPGGAQRAINRFAKRRLHYLGEWHTHAEDRPRPSASDYVAIRAIFEHSELNTAALILLIVGLAPADWDVGVWYMNASGGLVPV